MIGRSKGLFAWNEFVFFHDVAFVLFALIPILFYSFLLPVLLKLRTHCFLCAYLDKQAHQLSSGACHHADNHFAEDKRDKRDKCDKLRYIGPRWLP